MHDARMSSLLCTLPLPASSIFFPIFQMAVSNAAVLPSAGDAKDKDALTASTPAPPAPKVELVPFSDLFYFADGLDWFCMFLGTLSACATGVAMPVFMIIFGSILDEIGTGQGSFKDTINQLALAMSALGAGTFLVSAFQVAFFAYASARQTERLRATLLRSILRQVSAGRTKIQGTCKAGARLKPTVKYSVREKNIDKLGR